MSRRKEPAIPNELLDQLLAGGAASAAFEQGGLLDSLKRALTERALNAEMDHHLAADDGAGNMRNGYSRRIEAFRTAFRRRDDGTGARPGTRTNQDRPALGLCPRRPAMGWQ